MGRDGRAPDPSDTSTTARRCNGQEACLLATLGCVLQIGKSRCSHSEPPEMTLDVRNVQRPAAPATNQAPIFHVLCWTVGDRRRNGTHTLAPVDAKTPLLPCSGLARCSTPLALRRPTACGIAETPVARTPRLLPPMTDHHQFIKCVGWWPARLLAPASPDSCLDPCTPSHDRLPGSQLLNHSSTHHRSRQMLHLRT